MHEQVVRDHLAALARSDWAAFERTVSDGVQLKLVGLADDDWQWSLSTLYRHVTQAWDYVPEDVQLSDEGDAIVHARIRLSNFGHLKQIEGWYRISDGRIASITLTDAPPHAAADA